MPNIWSDPNGFLKDYRQASSPIAPGMVASKPGDIKKLPPVRHWETAGKCYR